MPPSPPKPPPGRPCDDAGSTATATAATAAAPPKPPPRTLRPPPSSLAPTPARLSHLVSAWAPTLRLHPTDAYHPCSGAWFAARSVLLERTGGRVLAPVGRASVAAAVAAAEGAAAAHPADPVGAARAVRLALDVTARHGQPLAELDAHVPLYVRAQLAIPAAGEGSGGGGRPTLELAYVALYAHNGPYFPLGEGWGGPSVGAHDGDLERLTVRLDAESGELLGAWFNSHRPRDGAWAGAGGVEIEAATGRPVAYVARHGHGTYPTPGIHARAWGLANDHCSAAGATWRPGSVVLLAADRGDLHPAPGAASAPELGFVECRGCEVLGGDGRAVCDATPPRGRPPRSQHADVRVLPDADGFGAFPGLWGETAGLRSQGWWARAECPVSRGVLKRLFLEGWPEA
jgi:hypothetical protein